MNATSSRNLPRRTPRRSWGVRALTAGLALGLALTGLSPAARANDDIILIQFLASTGADGDATARVRWRDKGDSIDFNVELEDLPSGSYALWVAGVQQGTLVVGGLGEGEIEFENPLDPPKPLFDFAVFDQLIEITQGATVFFSDVFSPGGQSGGSGGSGGGGGGGVDDDDFEIEVYMVNVGAAMDFDAQGRLRYEVEPGETKFRVRTEDLDAGLYDLTVDGVVRASFDASGYDEGEVEFENPLDDSSDSSVHDEELEIELALTFDPLGKLVTVRRQAGGQVVLTASMPETLGSSGVTPPSSGNQLYKDLGKSLTDKLQMKLLNTGVMPGAQGKVVYGISGEHELEIEIEDVASASYGVFVDGVQQATLSASAGQGQVKFSTSPDGGELLLDFEVRGAFFQIRSGAEVILQGVFPASVQAALQKYVAEKTKVDDDSGLPYRLKRNLVNAVHDLDTRGFSDWKLKGNGDQKLTLKLQDLPDGTYRLRLDDGVSAPQIVETFGITGGKAKLKFRTSPGSNQLLLDFAVPGMRFDVLDANDAVVLQSLMQ